MDSFLTPYDLSNSGEEKLQFTPFCGGPKPGCSDGLCTGTIESRNFFVLGPILVKFHIRTRLIESFRTTFRTWYCAEEKLHIPPFHTLGQLKRDEALLPPLRISPADERWIPRNSAVLGKSGLRSLGCHCWEEVSQHSCVWGSLWVRQPVH